MAGKNLVLCETIDFKSIEKSSGRKIWGKVKKAEEFYDINENIRPVQNKDLVIPLYYQITPVTSQKLIGVLEFDILTEKMFGDTDDLALGENGFIAIMDRDGEMIEPGVHSDFSNSVQLGMLDGNSGVRELKAGNRNYRIVFDTVSEIGYKIMAVIPEKELISGETRQRNILALSLIFGIVGVFFVTFITTNLLFSRFRVLIKMMKRIEGGEFDVRIDETWKDEVGELAHGFNQMAGKLEQMVLNLIEKETAHRDAELRALQSQINPHFLYNTIESMRMESELRGQDDLADALASLGKLFRYNIKWFGGLIPLRQEIEHVNNYITIMKVRFRGKIDYETNVPDEVLNCPVIKMMLQPLVENCFQHAFKDKEGVWKIRVKALISGDIMNIQIVDNGRGIDRARLDEINRCLMQNTDIDVDRKAGSSIGIWNVNKRIKMQYGDTYGITVESSMGTGTRINIIIPVSVV